MLQNQPRTTTLFQTSLRSWRADYLARQQAQTAGDADSGQAETAQPEARTAPQRVKRLAPRRRKKRQAAMAGA